MLKNSIIELFVWNLPLAMCRSTAVSVNIHVHSAPLTVTVTVPHYLNVIRSGLGSVNSGAVNVNYLNSVDVAVNYVEVLLLSLCNRRRLGCCSSGCCWCFPKINGRGCAETSDKEICGFLR